ncbi:MAG TPA: response regulator transcription factor [Gemmatimonadaceae bacterium]|jgi:DNA-binding response OmpR family regulator|nr:response regulator transcription factor [Gemmatimonadaceae bacterium]
MSKSSCCVAKIAIGSLDPALVTVVEQTLVGEGTEILRLDHDGHLPMVDGAVQQPDVVLLDRSTLDDFGRRMRHVRRRWPLATIVALNARDERDCARLLDEGADDVCLVRSALLPARLHAIARRARTLNADKRMAVGDLVIDRAHRRVWCAGDEVMLSPREYDVLSCLFHYAPRVVGKATLTEFVWGESTSPQPNTIEVYVGYLRRKLARSRVVAIETVRRAGYLLGQS